MIDNVNKKINKRINNINDINKIITKINDEVKKRIKSIFEIVFRLKGAKLKQADLNIINAKIDDALIFAQNKIFRENKISSIKINRDKHKDFYRYVSDKLGLLERVNKLLCNIASEIEDKMDIIHRELAYIDMYEIDIDELNLVISKLNQIIIQSKKDLTNIISLEDIKQK